MRYPDQLMASVHRVNKMFIAAWMAAATILSFLIILSAGILYDISGEKAAIRKIAGYSVHGKTQARHPAMFKGQYP